MPFQGDSRARERMVLCILIPILTIDSIVEFSVYGLALQLLAIVTGILFEFLHFSISGKDQQYKFWKNLASYQFVMWIFIYAITQDEELVLYKVGFWFTLWGITIAWLFGRLIVRQYLHKKLPE